MQRRNLRLNALRAFECTARHGSLVKAASELGVTHAAVSQQIKHLESTLGIELLRRSPRGIELTSKGRILLPVLRECFDSMGNTLDDLIAPDSKARLVVTTTNTFASRWLIPRLDRWDRSPVDLDVHVFPTLELLEIQVGAIDVAIRCGVPNWSSALTCERLFAVSLTPVCSPDFLKQHGPLNAPEDALAHTLIHADVAMADAGYEWRAWLKAVGVVLRGDIANISFHDPGLATQAAIRGLGIAMGYVELVQTDIEAGRLVRPYEATAAHPYSYYLAYLNSCRDEPKIRAFRDWIFSEVRTARDIP